MKTRIILGLLLLLPAGLRSQAVDISLKLQKDSVYRQISSATTTVNEEIGGMEIKIVMSVNGSTSYFVRELTDSAFNMDVWYDSLGMTMEMPQTKEVYSSESKDSTDLFSRILSGMKNKSFQVVMNRKGTILDVKNVEALWKDFADQMGMLSEEDRAQLEAMVNKAYGPEAFKGSIEMLSAIYPDSLVEPGESWSIHTQLESGMSASVNTEYTLVSITPDYVVITGQSVLATENKDAYVEISGMTIRYDLTGTMQSEFKVDLHSGWIIEGLVQMKMEGAAHFKGNPQMPDGMTVPMSFTAETKVSN